MKCKLNGSVVVLILAAWLALIVGMSLFVGTTGLYETFTQGETLRFADNAEYDPADTGFQLFEDNRVGAECCPSTYSSSNGCVCLKNDQLKLLRSRGGNRT
jgi:hypothetical protein